MSNPSIEAAQRARDYEPDIKQPDKFGEMVDASREALNPIRKLHKPLTIMCLAANCGAEVCDHEDECPADTPVVVCAECWQIVELASSGYYGEEGIDAALAWPCDTAKLVYAESELT